MKLVVFHVFAGDHTRQKLYAALSELSKWDVTLVVGANWRNDYGAKVQVGRSSRFRGNIKAVPILLPGHIPLHLYRSTLVKLLRAEQPNVIYVYHEPYGLATFQVFLANELSIRAPVGFYSSQSIYKRYPHPFRDMERWVFRNADFAVAVSNEVAEVLRQKGYRGRLSIVPFEIDTEHFCVAPTSRATIAPVGHRLRVGYVGRLVPEKGVDTLIRALALLEPCTAEAIVVGTGPSAGHLRALADEVLPKDSISFHGYVPNDVLPELYRSLDILVLPSRSTAGWKEQFGRVVLEALACGTAVIAAASGELPKLIEETGGGWTFRESDHQDLARKLKYVHDNRDELTRRNSAGRSSVEAGFGLSAVAEKLQRVMVQSALGAN